jgi:hypothetical protein
MSALPPRADICGAIARVYFGPEVNIRCEKAQPLVLRGPMGFKSLAKPRKCYHSDHGV